MKYREKSRQLWQTLGVSLYGTNRFIIETIKIPIYLIKSVGGGYFTFIHFISCELSAERYMVMLNGGLKPI